MKNKKLVSIIIAALLTLMLACREVDNRCYRECIEKEGSNISDCEKFCLVEW